jgi:hypothetical protein
MRTLADQVRTCLLQPPQPESLYVVRPGVAEGKAIRKARVTHDLEFSEELVAVWQWSKVSGLLSATPGSLIFMTDGIRIAEPRVRLRTAIGYDMFGEYTFR